MNDSKKRTLLFNEFPPVETSDWEKQIKIDLKGAEYEKRLVWAIPESFKVRPYYREEDLKGKEYLESLPGDSPYIRGQKTNSNEWEIRQDILVDNIETANQKSLFVLDRGITSLGFICPTDSKKDLLKIQHDFSALLKDICFDSIGLYFVCRGNAPKILTMIKNETSIKKIDPGRVTGALDYDPLGNLTHHGKFFTTETEDLNQLEKLLLDASTHLPNYKVLGINGYFFNNAGASVIQELGYSLAMAADYLARMTDAGIPVDTVCRHMQFNLGVGPSYFMEIAKIRAARLLWVRIVEAFKPAKEESKQVVIHSITTEWNQTIYEPYVNVLRATTEAMAAVIGGTDSLTVRPFTCSYNPTTKFSGRIARNIQIILKDEAYLGKIVDPSAGSYYIESLTDSIIDESWKLFLKIEDEGGYLEALKKGSIQSDIEITIQNRKNLVATRKEILLGTNQYPDSNESVIKEVVNEMVFPTASDSPFDVTPIPKFRGSMDFERLRLATERQPGGKPKVFMLTLGNPIMRKARASFSAGFFACAGYQIIDNPGFSAPDEGVKAAIDAKANIVVICSSDEEYPELAPAVMNEINSRAIVVVAGAPPCMDELKAKGIENFIHMRSNLLETLKYYHRKLGII